MRRIPATACAHLLLTTSTLSLMLAAGAMLVPVPVAAQTDAARQGGNADGAPSDIVVTGRATPGSVIGDIPAQNQIGAAEIATYGVGTVSELLDELADQTQSDQGRESSGPVILVNGKRISGINEVGDLPTEAVVQVDILPEEVALKYGYDTSRKVVNVILRRRFQARVVEAGGGLATEGGGGAGQGNASYTRIRGNDRLNLSARADSRAALLESDRSILADTTAPDDGNRYARDPAFRTLRPSTRSYALNGTYAHQLSDTLSASFNMRGSYATSRGLAGAAPIAADDINDAVALQALARNSDTATAHAGVTLNADLSTTWKLSLTGAYDHGDARGDTARFTNQLLRERTTAITDAGSAQLVAMGSPLSLPAGKLRTSLRIDAELSRLAASSTSRTGSASADSTARSDLNAQISVDVPLTSRRTGFLGALGTVTANMNGAVHRVSDYGTLESFGYGLNWTPRAGISLIASVSQDRVAPTLQQLQAPVLSISGLRVFDFVRGETVTVAQVTGGNSLLDADDRHVVKLAMTVKPVARLNLALNVSYLNSRTENPIGTVSGASIAAQAAFPRLFLRGEDGELQRIDARPINFAREDREQIRWGLTFSKVLRAAKRPPRPMPTATPSGPERRVFGTGVEGNGSQRGEQARSDRPPGLRDRGDPPQAQGDAEEEAGDIVVEGRPIDRDVDQDFGPPGGPPPDGFGPPPAGFEPPPGGGSPSGPPPGGFGGPGGPDGPGGRAGGNEARLQLSIWHSWYLRNTLLLRSGTPVLDLLGGDTLSGFAQPRHQIQFNAGVTDNGTGLYLGGTARAATVGRTIGVDGANTLRFSALATFDVRLFANLQQRLPRTTWARAMRVSLGVTNLLNRCQRVRDATGRTPLAYQGAYLDPLGRTVSLTVRRLL